MSIEPDSSLYGLSGGTADCVQAGGKFVLLVVQEPARVSQASDLHSHVAL